MNTKLNFVADRLSRAKVEEYDFMLDHKLFLRIVSEFGQPDIDLFATQKTA
jgi:hypothetical protein